MSTRPTYEQLVSAQLVIDQPVPPEFIDINGHMNVAHYLTMGEEGVWERLRHEVGMPDSYVTERNLTTFTAENHVRYFSELRLGDRFAVHARLVDASSTAIHGAGLIIDREKERLACVVETLLVHIDLSIRKPAPFPPDVAELLDAAMEKDNAYAWDVPVSGCLKIRR